MRLNEKREGTEHFLYTAQLNSPHLTGEQANECDPRSILRFFLSLHFMALHLSVTMALI